MCKSISREFRKFSARMRPCNLKSHANEILKLGSPASIELKSLPMTIILIMENWPKSEVSRP